MGEQIDLKTADGINISGSYVASANPSNIVVLLIHQLRKDKAIWDSLVQKLASSGFSSLAIDLRGHGQSGGGRWEDFSDEQFSAMANDVEAAGKYLSEKLPAQKVALIGSSIGANLALNYASKNDVSSLVLLSPGLDYKGITTEDAAGGFSKPIFMVASSDDPNKSVATARRLSEIITTPETDLNMTIYDDAGHGINMFTKHPELQDKIVEWLR